MVEDLPHVEARVKRTCSASPMNQTSIVVLRFS
jgi:hypothetical protein